MKKQFPTQAALLKTARAALTARTGFEKKGGQCKRFIRQICGAAGVPRSACPPTIIDAKQCAKWYRDTWPELCVSNGSLPGDILFYEKGHGKHGHVVMRELGNVVIENSVEHAPEDQEDARGVRPLARLGEPTLIVRVWRNK